MNIKTLPFTGTALILSATLLIAGCGGGDDEDLELTSASTQAAAKKSVDPASAGSVAGKIAFKGQAPKMNVLDMGADAVCQGLHKEQVRDQSVVVNGNQTLKNVVVSVKKGLEEYAYPAPVESPMLNQSGCVYEPHILIMTPGVLKIKNSDNTLHNVNAQAKSNKGFNRAQPMPSTIEEKFSKPEMVPFKCDVHPWMRAYVAVVAHPVAAATGDDGSFTLTPLPPGQYVIEAWHEKFGSQEMTVTVETGKTAEANFTFGAPGA